MLYGDLGRKGDPAGPAAAGAQSPVAGGPTDAAGGMVDGDTAGELRRQGIGSAEEIFWGVSDGEELELRMIL